MTLSTHCVPAPPFPGWGIPTPRVDASTVTIQDSTLAPVGGFTRRGIVVFLHPTAGSLWPVAVPPNNLAENIQGFATAVTADGWVFVWPAIPLDFAPTAATQTPNSDSWLFFATSSDPNHGALYNTQVALWWDHLLIYLTTLYGNNHPVLLAGYSVGAWHAAAILSQRQSSIKGAILHCLPTIFENISALDDPPTIVYGNINWSGMDLGQTFLNSTTIPVVVGTSTADTVVGYDQFHTPASNAYIMCSNAGANVTNYMQSPAEDHLFYSADTTFYISGGSGSWIPTNFPNASYPVNF